jgi:flagellar biogenesis protein FliO
VLALALALVLVLVLAQGCHRAQRARHRALTQTRCLLTHQQLQLSQHMAPMMLQPSSLGAAARAS